MRISVENKKLISSLIKYTYKVRGVDKKSAKTRKRYVVDTNIALCSFIRNNMHLPFQAIGSIFNKDHATIMHYCSQHDYLIGVDKEYLCLHNLIKKYFDDYGITQAVDESSIKNETKMYIDKMDSLRDENKRLLDELEKCIKEKKEIKRNFDKLSKYVNW
tara:strand:+ start:510 stop:989 length:480 start_codon:yes stop_codon:yes gene_type:complete